MNDRLERIRSDEFYQRTAMLLGEENLLRLTAARVCVCGVGGVGSAAAEALARSGVGFLRLVDFDTVSRSNLNRQLHTNLSNIGAVKAVALKERLTGINPYCDLEIAAERITAENTAALLDGMDYIVDAVDDVPAKIAIAVFARDRQIPLVVSMGTGNKIHPELLELADISKTEVCPLARKLRRELKKQGIVKGLPVVYSKEQPRRADETCNMPASIAFVPPVAGMILAGKVVRDLTGID
ncbi:MAG: tRNA threonylcarbamoyladenosine dehydratase [Bacillota bacterium]